MTSKDPNSEKPELSEKDLEKISGGMRPAGGNEATATTHISDQTATTDSDSVSD
jgi:bacteriocin-like protein